MGLERWRRSENGICFGRMRACIAFVWVGKFVALFVVRRALRLPPASFGSFRWGKAGPTLKARYLFVPGTLSYTCADFGVGLDQGRCARHNASLIHGHNTSLVIVWMWCVLSQTGLPCWSWGCLGVSLSEVYYVGVGARSGLVCCLGARPRKYEYH